MSIAALIPASARLSKRVLSSRLSGEPELRLVPQLCEPGALSLDIGANTGIYAWHLARYSRGLVAFEPQPRHAEFLRRALGPKVRVEEVALSDVEGEVILRVPRDRMQDGRATIEPGNTLESLDVSEIVVPRRRLDSYDFGPVGLIKVDVEGHELAVLKGGSGLIARDRPTLIVEAEDRHRPGTVEALVDYLATFGYRGHYLERGRLMPLDGIAPANAIGAAAAARHIYNFIFSTRSDSLGTLTA